MIVSRFTPGALLLDRYRIVEIRSGGMAEVAICRDSENPDGPLVAFKAIASELLANDEIRARFDREVEAWMTVGRGAGRFVLPLEEVIVNERSLLLKMPYCSKGTLRDRLLAGPLAAPQAMEYATEMLIGLHMLDVVLGLVHRDVKPENVLFDDNDHLQISDLGLVKFTGEEICGAARQAGHQALTQFGGFVGTVPYAAPEQLLGVQPIDSRVDIWAFGIVVYEMLMGCRPYPDDDTSGHLHTILTTAPRALELVAQRSSKLVAAVVARCLAPDPNDRYASLGDLVSAWDGVIKVEHSPKARLLTRDRRVPLPEAGAASAAWTGNFFPDRIPADHAIVRFNYAAVAGLSEARDYYRLDRYEDAIAAAEKTLGSMNDPRSNFARLLANRLPERVEWVHDGADHERRSLMVPSREMAAGAVGVQMRALVALVEERPQEGRWLEMLRSLSDRIVASGFRESDVLALAGQAYILAGDYAEATKIAGMILLTDPLHIAAGFVNFQAALRAGRKKEAHELARTLISLYVQQDKLLFHRSAVRLAYCTEEWNEVVRLGLGALSLAPDDFEILTWMTSALLVMKRRDDARPYYERMRRLAPKASETVQLAPAFIPS